MLIVMNMPAKVKIIKKRKKEMKFEKLVVKTPDRHGIMTTVHEYVQGLVHFRPNGFVYVYWGGSGNTDVYTGNYCFEVKKQWTN